MLHSIVVVRFARLAGAFALLVALCLSAGPLAAQEGPIKDRHLGSSRAGAAQMPRSEGDQAIVDGWPLYRTERGQAAFNATMATLKATEAQAPAAGAFKGCERLQCVLSLPSIGADGFIPAGRIWVSPGEYVLVVHSPRGSGRNANRRRGRQGMRYFVFHEFHNSTRNTDLYDTISAHKGSVFVPFYMSKSATDAFGRRFVVVVQVAPYDVVSVHATNFGSAGPGIEVARNWTDAVDPLQNLAGIVIASIAKAASNGLKVVNHGGNEGLPMLKAYAQHLEGLRGKAQVPGVTLPFVPAAPARMASASARLRDLILRPGASPRIPVAARAVVPPKFAPEAAEPPVAETADEIAALIIKTAAEAETPPMLIRPVELARRPTRTSGSEPVLLGPIRPAVRPQGRPTVGGGG